MVMLLLLLAFADCCTVGMALRLLLYVWTEEFWPSACIRAISELALTAQNGLIGGLPWCFTAAGAVCWLLLSCGNLTLATIRIVSRDRLQKCRNRDKTR